MITIAEHQVADAAVRQVSTEVLTLKTVKELQLGFVIPSYQRPYVWRDEDVIKLFDDIREAYLAEEPQYFIGSVLSAVRNQDGCRLYELIDGQQRITTLMLLSLAFRAAGEESSLAQASTLGEKPRLTFDIREAVDNLLGSHASLERMTRPGPDAIANDPYLTHLDANLRVLGQQVEQVDKQLAEQTNFSRKGLANYIYENVCWVNNIVPDSMDLNRLFASMNTAGVQLEPVDLLKAKLFRKLTTQIPLYSAIWQACEHMENYFERNLRQLFPNANWNAIEYAHLQKLDRSGIQHNTEQNAEGKAEPTTLRQLLDAVNAGESNDNIKQKLKEDMHAVIEDETVNCRSIISFELLLIHALRVFCVRQNWSDISARIKASNLMACFECLLESEEADIKAFIETLWKVRYQFDTWVVKWVEHDYSEDPQLRLTNLSRSQSSGKYYINRSAREPGDLAQLQAVRNFSGDRSAHYWLTALLSQLVDKPDMGYGQVLSVMETLDNQLSLAVETQKDASFKIAKGDEPDTEDWSTIETYLNESRGTGFEHYWFQKLEYLLWKWRDKIWKRGDKSDDKLKQYRITSKNSVEHVHPQNEEYGKLMGGEWLDAFGNLVLLSPGENSSYSNQTVGKKREDFVNKPRYDSLKLKAIFELYDANNRVWGEDQIRKHQKDMVEILRSHYMPGKGMGSQTNEQALELAIERAPTGQTTEAITQDQTVE